MATRLDMSRLLVSIFIIFTSITSLTTAQDDKYITYNTALKLMNLARPVRLHSHEIKYGSGSGQQSVTATDVKEDGNSYWMIKGPTGTPTIRGEPVKCGDIIRLQHLATKKNLHSHHVSSPLSGKQEVSAYGDEESEGDTGDHWEVVCDTEFWVRSQPVSFTHIDTQAYLSISGRTYGAPIAGQVEVVGVYSSSGDYIKWQAMEGLFIHSRETMPSHDHTEL